MATRNKRKRESSDSISSSDGEKHSSSHHKKHKKKQESDRRNVKDIGPDDFYNKNSEFRTWLIEKYGAHFDSYSSSKAKKMFKKFCKKWNKGKLNEKYYNGIQPSTIEREARTGYKWKFASDIDDIKLGSVKDKVGSWTKGKGVELQLGDNKTHPKHVGDAESIKPIQGPAAGPRISTASQADKEEWNEYENYFNKKRSKNAKEHDKMVLDELLPKATGREAVIEKRKARSETRRHRDVSPGVSESFLMGSSGPDIERNKRKREERRVRRYHEAVEKVKGYQEKEKSRMAELLALARATKSENALW
ncbi:uncharacterized protein TRIADDRAFT_60950 [Trichoplax adhaerens]|uniref:Uncharacterized protein n=1 Tax=Trichoplax adhaerens TaxID=10228 RepID=B3S9L5_TRIAD|nr:hypothetical protein TRIADDRAFT_60950 [Trichoplax adhaerens]EDV20496.1 hypothetical protein TRIADDRAFT_60950 [Trichoplax adhaerens]|eukprot:XP_002116922.1 hypothetical protein TRIADDRAFT_60950 [Trichoplax adhaerens]